MKDNYFEKNFWKKSHSIVYNNDVSIKVLPQMTT